jgi:hypothetical protein
MIAGEFDSISKTEIDALVASKEPERRSIEYKLELPAGNDEGSREFLADASSLANAAGGDLIFGIRAKDGVPESAEGLVGANPDKDILRLEQMLRDGLDPRIPGVRTKHIEGFPSGPVIIMRIPKSWVGLHMVKFKGSQRFFTRASNGKHPMDVREIKAAFLASETVANKIAAFRADRLGKILIGETPVSLEPGPKIVLHFLPIRAFSEAESLNLKQVEAEWDIHPMAVDQWATRPRFNFKGLLADGSQQNMPGKRAYIQIFRNGAFESVFVGETAGQILFGLALEEALMQDGPSYIEFLDQYDLGPMFVALSVISAKGFAIMPDDRTQGRILSISKIDEDVLEAPESLIEEKGGNIRKLLHCALDSIWQASGWRGSLNYDKEGNWNGILDR